MSNDIPESLDKFAGELERAIKRRLERPPARKRPRLLAGTTLGFAAGATALALLLTAASSSPAFAVTRNHDGTVSVRIMRVEGLAGANARLAAMHIHARFAQVAAPVGCALRLPALPPPGPPVPSHRPGRPLAFRVRPGQIPAGRMLVIPALVIPRRIAGRPLQAVRPTQMRMALPSPAACVRLMPPPCVLQSFRKGVNAPGPRAVQVPAPRLPQLLRKNHITIAGPPPPLWRGAHQVMRPACGAVVAPAPGPAGPR